MKEHNLLTDKFPSVPPLPFEYDTDKYRGISVSEVTALNDSVFDDHINTTYPSWVNAVTTISGFLHGNHQSIQTVFSQVTDFQIHKLEPLSLAISNHNPLLEGHP